VNKKKVENVTGVVNTRNNAMFHFDNTLEVGSAMLWCRENIYLKEAKFLKKHI